MADPWNPAQYGLYRDERKQPFHDLLGLVRRRPGMLVLDLGCGTGDLTLELHRELGAAETLGVDSSAAMLGKAPAAPGLRFQQSSIEDFEPAGSFDLIFSNAALHFVPNHPRILLRMTAALSPGGQLALHIPANEEHPSHQTAFELAREPEFKRALDGFERRPGILDPTRYAGWLHRLGYARQHVRLQVYTHLLPSRESVIEWVRGALLTDYERRLPAADYARFLARYRERLLPQLEDERPFLYTYPRILIWGEL